MKKIAVAGTILVDKINTISAYPSIGRLTKILSTKLSVGGLVPNVGIDIKRICPNIPVVAYGRVGNDGEGQYVLSQMHENGMEIDKIVKSNDNTSFTSVMSIPGAERTFFTYPGASSSFGIEDIDFGSFLDQISHFHLGYFMLLDKVDNGDGLKILKALKERNITTSIDFVSEQSESFLKVIECLKYVDNLILNELEASAITGVKDLTDTKLMCQELFKLGVRERVIIHYSDGAVCMHDGVFSSVNRLNVDKSLIKGKTGAGDAFTAGCLVAIYQGKTDREMLDLGVRSAGVSLLEENAVDAMVEMEKIYQITKNGEIKKC